jgi:hypothetical protein
VKKEPTPSYRKFNHDIIRGDTITIREGKVNWLVGMVSDDTYLCRRKGENGHEIHRFALSEIYTVIPKDET